MPPCLTLSFPAVTVVELETNRGFGSAMNTGVEATEGDYLLLLNPDTWALEGAVASLAGCLNADPQIGVAGPRL